MKTFNISFFKLLFFLLVLLSITCRSISIGDVRVRDQLSYKDKKKTKHKSKDNYNQRHESPESSPSLSPLASPSPSPQSWPPLAPSSSPSPLFVSPSSTPLAPSSSPSPLFVSPTSSPRSNVLDYGAIGDGIVDNTNAFQEAWEDACNFQGGNLEVPYGYNFLVGPIIFKGPCNGQTIFLLEGEILAPKLPSEWGDLDKHPKWIKFEELSNLILKGEGTINGQGEDWWSCKREGSCKRAPTALSFDKCDNCTISDIKFVDSPQIFFEFFHSNHGLVDSITIHAPGESPNTDGIHIQKSTFIDVQNSFVETGDDCVSIVSGSHDIKVMDMYCGTRCHGISIGSLGKDGAKAEVSNVDVRNCTLEGTTNGLRIKSWPGGQGYAQDITYSDITMKNVENPIIIDQHYCPHVDGKCQDSSTGVKVSNIIYNNIIGTSASEEAITFNCSKNVPCKGIALNNVQLKHLESGRKTTSSCTNAHGIATQSNEPSNCFN